MAEFQDQIISIFLRYFERAVLVQHQMLRSEQRTNKVQLNSSQYLK